MSYQTTLPLKIQLPQLLRSIFSCSLVLHGSSDSLPVMTTFLYNLVCFLEEQGMVKRETEQASLRMSCELGLAWCVSATAACNFGTVRVLENSCWGLAFWRRSPNQYDPRSKNTQEEKKRQLSVRWYTEFIWYLQKPIEKIFHSLVLGEPLRKQENPSAKFPIRWYYLDTWSVKPGLQQLTMERLRKLQINK